eukprot:1658480-Amphidinium_carterae.2
MLCITHIKTATAVKKTASDQVTHVRTGSKPSLLGGANEFGDAFARALFHLGSVEVGCCEDAEIQLVASRLVSVFARMRSKLTSVVLAASQIQRSSLSGRFAQHIVHESFCGVLCKGVMILIM